MSRVALIVIVATAVVVAGIVFLGGGVATEKAKSPPEAGSKFEDRDAGVEVEIPLGWKRSQEVINENLVNPRELLFLSTFSFDRSVKDCGPFYDHVLGQMDSREGFVAIQERLGGAPTTRHGKEGYPPRPKPFRLEIEQPEKRGCGRDRSGNFVYSSWITFRDSGRAFYAQVEIGAEASDQTRTEATEILDSLRFSRSAPRSIDTDPPELGAKPIECPVGERPDYFVPGGENALIAGCARLQTSGQTMSFSVNAAQIGSEEVTCLNPTYGGRGYPGMYIPSTCPATIGQQLRVRAARVPRQGVRGYARVIWGVAPHGVQQIEVEAVGQRGHAAIFEVAGRVRRASGASRNFNLFVAEVPEGVQCGEVTLTASSGEEVAGCGR